MSDQSSPTSPLSEAQAESLDELFSKDPLSYSDQDLDQIIASLRAQRTRWDAAEAQGAKRAPGSKTPPKTKASESIALGDLGL